MPLSLVAALIPIVNILWCGEVSANNCSLARVLLSCGYGQACTYSSLKACEINGAPTPNECSLTEDIVLEVKNNTNALTVVQTLLQENITNVLTEVKTLLQVVKSELKNVSNFQSEIKTLLQEIKSERENSVSEIKAIRQEIKSEGENSSSVVKALLQEVKSERENSVSEIKAIRQEIQSEGENSSSVVKALLQEVKSERENSVSEIKTLLQEVKTEQQNEKKRSEKIETVINSMLKNCADLRVILGDGSSEGVQTVYPYLSNQKEATVYCDQVTDGGGWTVIQNRSPLPIRENFTRSWNEYVVGFGDLKGEFWLGLDNIHALTNSAQMELRVDLEDAEGEKRFAKYRTFHVGDAASKYVLRIEGYSGDAGDAMIYPTHKDGNSNGMKFSTFDNDNDLDSRNCAKSFHGGWWFNACFAAHLNGLPLVGKVSRRGEGIHWNSFRNASYSLKKANMKIRPVSLGF